MANRTHAGGMDGAKVRGGLVQGVGPDETPVAVGATEDGRLKVDVSDDGAEETALEMVGRLLAEILDEQRATRLALQSMYNEGSVPFVDFLKLARSIRCEE